MKAASLQFGILVAALTPWVATGCGNANLPAATASAEATVAAKPADTVETKPAPAAAAAAKTETPGRSARLPAKGGKSDLTFDDIKFNLDKKADFKRSMLTPKIEALEGRQVQIRGYILPSFQQTGLTQFVLVRDNMQCCFGPGAALYDCIVVEMKPGVSTNFTIRPVGVQGVFTIREFLDPDGKPLAIYHLDGEAVQ